MTTEAFSVKGAAKALAISAETVYRKAADGSIPSFRVGRNIRIPEWFINDLNRKPGELPASHRTKRGAK